MSFGLEFWDKNNERRIASTRCKQRLLHTRSHIYSCCKWLWCNPLSIVMQQYKKKTSICQVYNENISSIRISIHVPWLGFEYCSLLLSLPLSLSLSPIFCFLVCLLETFVYIHYRMYCKYVHTLLHDATQASAIISHSPKNCPIETWTY